MTEATWFKLSDGSWGIKIADLNVKSGDRVQVLKKSGETSTETVEKVFELGGNVSCRVCSIKKTEKTQRRVCAECGCGGPLVEDLEDGLMKHYNCCDIPS